MQIDLTVNIEQVLSTFQRVENREIPFALAKSITRTASITKAAEKAEIQRVFDRPKSYTVNAVYSTVATKANLSAKVGLKGDDAEGGPSVGKGTPASKYLAPEVRGGSRRQKRFERALIGAGLMLPGQFAVAPRSDNWAVKLDAYGNLRASLIVKLLAYFKAFGESGYKANMSGGKLQKLAKLKRNKSGHKTIGGVVYFVSFGKGRGNNLAPGIWAKRGTHGSDVVPVVIFTKDSPTYRPRFRFYAIAEQTIRNEFNRQFQLALREGGSI